MKRKILNSFAVISLVMAIETPKYIVLEQHNKVEIREYQSIVVAVTQVSKPYRSAQSEGFRRIASYIFGGNNQKMEIAMTAPVISTRLNLETETHEVFFVMPREHQFNKLPIPDLESVKLEERRLSRVAAISFGGWATVERAAYYEKQLKKKVEKLNLETNGEYMVAQYNSPWAVPPFRKNEILVKIK